MNFELLNNILTILGGLVLLLTFMKSVFEYVKQGTQKRFELYSSIERDFRQNYEFQEIRKLLNSNNPSILNIDKKKRSDYAAFFEQLALLVNSRLIKKEIACYLFSSDAITCWENESFWQDFNKNDQYWGVLRKFVEEMKLLRPTFQKDFNKINF